MGKLRIFDFVTLNGFFEGPDHDISWHRHGGNANDFAAEMLDAGGILLFGRATYELMAGYWPTPEAIRNDPVVAHGMNSAEKIVFSRTLEKVSWNNTRVMKDNVVEEIRTLKHKSGKAMTILGSGSIVSWFAREGLIDEYQIMVDPVVLPDGTPLFRDARRALNLELIATRSFDNGAVLLCYRPAKS